MTHLFRWGVLVLAVLLWQLAAGAHASVFFPPPSTIAAHMRGLWFDGPVAHAFLSETAVGNILPSVARMGAGFLLAAALGVVLGLALGRSAYAHAALSWSSPSCCPARPTASASSSPTRRAAPTC
ncbi:hypothetical protein RCO28_28445 [Streptomyces sp. LHD-70]|uniref:hypothetical protein n=1 Tax=Streptomyces sp. LHD-70 TaxID=3072140 RepID=UPI00280E3567|nr:hypothetical protein [Streptomyces sp. LHD-70]MDQ8706371.1 hypothetical protein [Streptomyces sp. LHD-70]